MQIILIPTFAFLLLLVVFAPVQTLQRRLELEQEEVQSRLLQYTTELREALTFRSFYV